MIKGRRDRRKNEDRRRILLSDKSPCSQIPVPPPPYIVVEKVTMDASAAETSLTGSIELSFLRCVSF